MKIYKALLFSVLLLSSCAVKYPNQAFPQGVSKIYLAVDNADNWNTKFFLKNLQSLLKEHKVECRVGERVKSFFSQETNFNPSEQQKRVQDIVAFKPDIILEVAAFNFAINPQAAGFVGKSANDIAVVRDTADLKRAIEKHIELQDGKKLTNYGRASVFLYLPNQYAHVWHTGIVEKAPDTKADTAEASLVKVAERLVEKLVEAKIIK